MTAGRDWRPVVESALGPLAGIRGLGGDVWTASSGSGAVVVKTGPGVSDEADGLARLAAAVGAPPVPEVRVARPGLLVLSYVDQAARTPDHETALGRMLGLLHRPRWPEWGGGSSWIGRCPVDAAVHPDAASFYGARIADLAARCRLEREVEPVVARLGTLLPPDGPSLVHGDLWWGNVLWGADGRPWLIDPSAHGGHPEEDLAMLALFGTVPDAVVRSYVEVRPLAEGWEDRVGLFQLVPLLVHTILFGGAYRARAEEVLHRLS